MNPFGSGYDSKYAENILPQQENYPVEAQTAVEKCDKCGANMTFSPEKRCLYCEHCGSEKQIDMSRFGEEIDFAYLLKNNNSWSEETHLFQCNNCGAKEVLSKSEIAKACPFCGTTNIVELSELSGLKPNAVLPFTIGKETALERIKRWARSKFFAPTAFKKGAKTNDFKGAYTPAFTFDTETISTYSGTLGVYYYVTVRRNGKSYREQRIRYFPISGTFRQSFDDILVHASNQIDTKNIKCLEPFDTGNSNMYSQEFLSGFTASQYTRDGHECWTEARQKIEVRLKQLILGQYTYNIISSLRIHTSCNNLRYKYLLLPVYVGHFTFKAKLYNFFMNGRNGKITGKTPTSALKVFLLSLGIAAAVAAGVLIYFFGYSG